jgi:hypothetical protein
MSKRPILKKKANKLRKAMRRQLPAYIDLVQYLKDRRYARTTGEAEEIILAKRVKSESHVLGIKKEKRLKSQSRMQIAAGKEPELEEVDAVDRLVSAKLRSTIVVLPA